MTWAEEEDIYAEGGGEPGRDPRREQMLKAAVALREAGVSESVALDLLAAYPAEKILVQASWLPYRKAKRKSSLLVAAIKGDYEKPAALEEGGEE